MREARDAATGLQLPTTFRRWRLRRAERQLRDEAWRIEEWGMPGVYPSERDKARERFYRMIRRVHRLGGDPSDSIRYTRMEHHIEEALRDA